MLLLYIFGPFGKKGGNSWFHAAVGKPGFRGISTFQSSMQSHIQLIISFLV